MHFSCFICLFIFCLRKHDLVRKNVLHGFAKKKSFRPIFFNWRLRFWKFLDFFEQKIVGRKKFGRKKLSGFFNIIFRCKSTFVFFIQNLTRNSLPNLFLFLLSLMPLGLVITLGISSTKLSWLYYKLACIYYTHIKTIFWFKTSMLHKNTRQNCNIIQSLQDWIGLCYRFVACLVQHI